MESLNLSPYCSAGQSKFWTNDSLGIKSNKETVDSVLKAMKNCYQFKDINIHEHGLMVNTEYLKILLQLEKGEVPLGMPEQILTVYKNNWRTLIDYEIMKCYQIWHDCGKPYCKIIDEEGKQHFPNHTQKSYEIFKEVLPHLKIEQYLILHDMDYHVLKIEDLKELSESEYGFSLYLTAWAEILANSSMFGGIDSVSFKIKKKKLIRCLKLFS